MTILLTFIWSFISSTAVYSTATTQIEDVKHLVAFSHRAPGFLFNIFSDLNNQKKRDLDFTYTRVLGGKAITLDVVPSAIPGARHIQSDFMTVKLPLNSLETLIFELPPSAIIIGTPDHDGLTFLPRAITRASFFLKEDGLFFIEHWPFLTLYKESPKLLIKAKMENPFNAFLNFSEANFIGRYLYEGKVEKTIQCELVDEAFNYIYNALNLSRNEPCKSKASKEMGNLLLSQLREDPSKIMNAVTHILLGEYWMLSQKGKMMAFMESKGFKDIKVERLEQSPYNGRTHIWAIQAKRAAGPVIKPKTTGAAAGGGAPSEE